MKFYNMNNSPKAVEVEFKTKTAVTGLGFVTIGQRIRGLLSNNVLDLTGVQQVDDYDDNPVEETWQQEKDVAYDETQDFMDKLDLADKSEIVSSRLEENIEEQISSMKSAKSKQKEVSSVESIESETIGGDGE